MAEGQQTESELVRELRANSCARMCPYEEDSRLSPRPSSVGSQAWQAYELLSAMSRRDNSFRRNYADSFSPDESLAADRIPISFRDKCLAYCLSCLDLVCIWECCGAWLRVQRIIALIVFDPFTELFIILCILINTLFMALDSDDADEQMQRIFERGNYFFTATFALEASMKIMALSPKFYFREGWNVFDSIIVGLSLLELGLEGVYGLSVLRSFRLLRVFKLAKSWPTLNLLISIMGKAVGDLGNLTFVVAIIVFIFAVMGMQLFGTKYVAQNFPSGELPRWNFTDFMHSFMIVFRILCAEWIEPMWDCLLVGGWPCIPFFLIAVTVGNLVVLNLFLALLLASFGASNLSSPSADNVDTKKLQEAIARFKRFGCWTRRQLCRLASCLVARILCRNRAKGTLADVMANHADGGGIELDADGKQMGCKSHIVTMTRMERQQNIERRTEELKRKIRRSPEHHYHLRELVKSQMKSTNAHQSTPSMNYNYPDRMCALTRELCTTGADYYPERRPPSARSLGPTQSHHFHHLRHHQYLHTESAFGRHQSSLGAKLCQPNATTTIPIIVDEAIDRSNSCSLAEEEEELSSLRGEESEFAPLDPDVPFQEDDFKRHSAGQLGGPSGLIRTPSFGPVEIGKGCANNKIMSTIREDSKDEATSSCSTSLEANEGGKLPDLSMQPANSMPGSRPLELTSSKSGEKAEVSRQESAQIEPSSSGSGSKEAVQHDKQLATKAETGAESGESDKVEHEHEQQSLVGSHSEFAAEGGASSSEVDEQSRPKSSLYLRPPNKEDMEEEDEKTLQHIESYIEKCICIGIICLKWFLFRQFVRRIVEHKYFDQCILVLIVISSGTLALEDKHLNERPLLKQTLDVLDTIFTIIFSLEMLLKWLAFGMRRYFGNIWSWLDFIIVLVSFINLMASIFGSGKIQALKTMRTLRAMRGLRPLRALQRFQGMRVVVNALIQAIPSIFNVLLVCLIFWLIFSIMGVQMFGGKFWRCLDPVSQEVISFEIASNKFECLERNLTWSNPQINFDNVPNAYLALFQVVSVEVERGERLSSFV